MDGGGLQCHGAQHGIYDKGFPVCKGLGCLEVFAKEGRKCEAVGLVEVAQRRDHQVQISGRQITAENAAVGAAFEKLLDDADRRWRVFARPQRLADVLASVQVFVVEQRYEVGVLAVIVQRESDHDLK